MPLYKNLSLFFSVVFAFSIFTSNSFSQNEPVVAPKISVDVGGNHAVSTRGANGELSVNTGYSIGFEVLSNFSSGFNFGGGLTYLIPREQSVGGSGGFSFVPVYAAAIIDLFNEAEVIPSLIGSIGYNVIFTGDADYKGPMITKGGLYLGAGVRLAAGRIFFETLFKSFDGSASYQNLELDVTYTTFSIGIGVKI